MLILVFELRMLLPKSLDHLRVLKSGAKLERVWSGIRIGWRSISVLDSPGVYHARLHFSIFVIHLMIRLQLLELSSAILAKTPPGLQGDKTPPGLQGDKTPPGLQGDKTPPRLQGDKAPPCLQGDQPINQSINRSIHQSINHAMHHSMNQSINQSINRSFTRLISQ